MSHRLAVTPRWPGRARTASLPARASCGAALALAVTLGACTPALDWREVRPSGTQLQVLFPCKPIAQQRTLSLASKPLALTLQACQADGLTWAISHADVADPARVGPALLELKAAMLGKMGPPVAPWTAPVIPGATPHADSGVARFAARGSDQRVMQMQVALFAHGTQVFQATVLGPVVPEDAAGTFFSSMRLRP
jgi:hypothetical protein